MLLHSTKNAGGNAVMAMGKKRADGSVEHGPFRFQWE
jgi:hypothetical protein